MKTVQTLSMFTAGAYFSVSVFSLSRRKKTCGSTFEVSCHVLTAFSIVSTRNENNTPPISSPPYFSACKNRLTEIKHSKLDVKKNEGIE